MLKTGLKIGAFLICLLCVLWAIFTVIGMLQLGAFMAVAGVAGLALGAAVVGLVKWKLTSKKR